MVTMLTTDVRPSKPDVMGRSPGITRGSDRLPVRVGSAVGTRMRGLLNVYVVVGSGSGSSPNGSKEDVVNFDVVMAAIVVLCTQ